MSKVPTNMTLVELGEAYRNGSLTPTAVTAAYLERAQAGLVYRELLTERAMAQAERADRQFESGIDIGPLHGVPLALKDLIDIEGTVTVAGSPALAGEPPAEVDAPVAARLDAAGAVFLGKTNMTELAFSGIGMNPHYGTPPNRFDPESVPGGSSSGSAVAVAMQQACAAVGSDTGGSVRIPATFNGLVGLKTSEGAIPTDGCRPLSVTLDVLGPLSRTVADAWLLFRAMAALPPAPLPEAPARLRLAAPRTVLREGLAPEVEAEVNSALKRLEGFGHEIVEIDVPLFREIEESGPRLGTFAAHESFALYGELIERHGARMDPRVTGRIVAARGRPSSDYIRLMLARRRWQREFWSSVAEFDAVVGPTVPILPPKRADLEDDAAYFEANRLCLRHTSLFNAVGGASISVPAGRGPVGLMVSGPPGTEGLVSAVGQLLEASAD